MHRVWFTVIAPVIEAVEPSVVLQLGGDEAEATRNLEARAAVDEFAFHVVDRPEDVVAADLVLLDADRNWSTVRRTLDGLARACAAAGAPFPVVLVRHVGWPYGRRDGYADPAAVPEDERRPFERAGVVPGREALVAGGGFAPGEAHAVEEGGERNGVRTAIEDFMAETADDLLLLTLPVLHGIGVLASADMRVARPELDEVLERMRAPVFLLELAEDLERIRIEDAIAAAEETERVRAEVERLRTELARERRWREDAARLLDELAAARRSPEWRLAQRVETVARRVSGRHAPAGGELERALERFQNGTG